MSITPEDQLTLGGRWPHEDCGEACVVSILRDAGHPADIATVEAAAAAAGEGPSGTDGAVLVGALAAAGVGAVETFGDASSTVADGRSRGATRFVMLITSDAWGNPYRGPGAVGHWVLTDGVDIMNPIGGRLIPGGFAAYLATSQSDVITVTSPVAPTITRSTVPMHLNAPVVAVRRTPSGNGYAMVTADGGYFPFGDAPQGMGSEGGTHLNAPAVDFDFSADGRGYIIVCADGGVFTHGDAAGYGSIPGLPG